MTEEEEKEGKTVKMSELKSMSLVLERAVFHLPSLLCTNKAPNIPELELIQIVICDGQKKQLRITLPVILNTPPLIQG